MDSAALLDLLGNDNRRRILRLLARRPCYVTEISEQLSVSPKAVIDHLRKLEDAGLVESRVDDQRRKYFSIARNVRLEVTVSPHGFGAKSAYPASANLDLGRCRHLSVEIERSRSLPEVETNGGGTAGSAGDAGTVEGDGDAGDGGDAAGLASELDHLRDLRRELSMAQRWVQGRIEDVYDRIEDGVETDDRVDHRLYADVLIALDDGATTIPEIARSVSAPPGMVETALAGLECADLVRRDEDRWTLR
ncbi:MarR family transcriptional regulator [Halobacteriales archaeon SW_7_68_16]|nr:MAG: MarR family transcriptional regulator [Halobacteriales archaeon SW_7_68_16]